MTLSSKKTTESHRRWRLAHKLERAADMRQWRQNRKMNDPERAKEYNRQDRRNYRAASVEHRLADRIRARMHGALRGGFKSGSAVRDLGCSIPEYKQYLESKFQPGMTWDNWGMGTGKWQIDHIVPLSRFNLTDREQFLKAVHYMNTQPLWWMDNIKKGNR